MPRNRSYLPRAATLVLVLALAGCASSADQIRVLRQQAAAGDTEAELALGRRYAEGDGVPQDAVQAASLFRKAAEAGNDRAQLALGILYRDGIGVPQDQQESVRWIRKAAESGNAPAQYVLGSMYENGEGVARDVVAAHAWLNLAAAGLPPGEREQAARHRDWLAEVMTPSQIAEAQQLAREWSRSRK